MNSLKMLHECIRSIALLISLASAILYFATGMLAGTSLRETFHEISNAYSFSYQYFLEYQYQEDFMNIISIVLSTIFTMLACVVNILLLEAVKIYLKTVVDLIAWKVALMGSAVGFPLGFILGLFITLLKKILEVLGLVPTTQAF